MYPKYDVNQYKKLLILFYLFCIKSSKLHLQQSQFLGPTFQGLKSRMWLMAMVLFNSSGLEGHTPGNKLSLGREVGLGKWSDLSRILKFLQRIYSLLT